MTFPATIVYPSTFLFPGDGPNPGVPIQWDKPDQRYYHTGCDRGVIYVDDRAYPWNGITGITESGAGEKTVYYRDGIIYYADVEPGDFEGSINAFFWPDQFSKCLGVVEIAPGLYADYQKPTPFGASYRHLVGSGTEGDMFGYQIHLIYNAVAQVGSRTRKTLSQNPEIAEFSFELSAVPVKVPGFRPTAHFIIDTRGMDPAQVTVLEMILYGGGLDIPRLPDPAELYDILNFGSAITFVDHGDGTWTASGSSSNIIDNGDGTWEINNVDGIDNGDGTYILSDTT